MKYVAFAVVLALHCATLGAVPSFAQEDPAIEEPAADTEITVEAPAPAQPAPLEIAPAGFATPSRQEVRNAAVSVLSPLGSVPILVSADANSYGVSVTLRLDGQRNLYTYNCGAQRCTGFATDLWRALPSDTRQAYVEAVIDSIASTAPGLHIYVVELTGQDRTGAVQARASMDDSGQRGYFSFPN